MTTGAGTPKGKRPTRPGLPVWWRCLDCDASGTGDRDAERHTDDTRHGTITQAHPFPPCMECEWEMIRDMGGRFIRYVRHEPCAEHYRDTPSDTGTGRPSTKGGTLPRR